MLNSYEDYKIFQKNISFSFSSVQKVHLSLQITLSCRLCLQAQFFFKNLLSPILKKTEAKTYVYEKSRNEEKRSRKKKTKKQVQMLPTWLLMEGRVGEEIQFFFHPISLRSWFSDFKNVSFKLSYFSSLCASFKLQFFPMPHIFSMGLTWVTYSNCDLGFLYNEPKFYCGSWGF